MLGGKRNVEKGIPQPDVEGEDFVVQVKDRQRVPTFLFKALADAATHATTRGKEYPLVVLTTPTSRSKLVIMADADFLKLWKERGKNAEDNQG
jgi:hypothetical protein